MQESCVEIADMSVECILNGQCLDSDLKGIPCLYVVARGIVTETGREVLQQHAATVQSQDKVL
jgi:hypothetical protein